MTGREYEGLAHQLIYQLLYPAFLGAFIYALWQHLPGWAKDWSPGDNQPWGLLFAIYFALQFVRLGASRTDRLFWLFDAAELILLIGIFDRLGYADRGPIQAGSPDIWTQILMMLVLALPPVKRMLADKFNFLGRALLALSVVAVLSIISWSVGFIEQGHAFWIISFLMLLYAGCLILLDIGWLDRPPPRGVPQASEGQSQPSVPPHEA